jgi:hypothetical protein
VERFDLEKMFRWKPYQSGAGRAYGISDADAGRRLYLVNADKIYFGFGAFKIMVLCNPISYLVTYAVLAAPGAGDSRFRNVVVAVLLVLFSPVFAPVGEAIYAVVARNRRFLSSNSHCRIEQFWAGSGMLAQIEAERCAPLHSRLRNTSWRIQSWRNHRT